MPYFRELVDLVSLEKLCTKYAKLISVSKGNITQEKLATPKKDVVNEIKPKITKRSYQTKLNNEQYKLLADCIETIKLFRSKNKSFRTQKTIIG